MKFLATAIIGLAACCALGQEGPYADLVVPETDPALSMISGRFEAFDVILKPDTIAPEWWAGAPSVVRDHDGVFWLACRMRIGEGTRGQRGYEMRIMRSDDGINFETALSIHREDVPIGTFERPALIIVPETGAFRLYGCGPNDDGIWGIFKFDDAPSPAEFDPTSIEWVILPRGLTYERDQPPTGYKDPVVIHAGGKYHCYVIGYVRRNERIFHFVSDDGIEWEPAGNPYNPIMQLENWHDFFIRPASVVPMAAGYLFVYEGSNTAWYDPVYNLGTGLGFTFDLHHIHNLTTVGPLALSSTPNPYFSTFRYSHWMWVDDELWIYAEVAAEDETHELRLFRLKRE
jgi:hypothetical protein